jgi:hypothetical protein
MTGTTIYNPPAGDWGALRVGDTDTRTKNFGPDLATIPDTISSVTGTTITRTDGVAMGANDLSVSAQPGIDSTNTQVTLQLSGGVSGVTYDVAITIATVGPPSRTITRDTQILVAAAVG